MNNKVKKRRHRSWKAWAVISHDQKNLEWVSSPDDSCKNFIIIDKKVKGENIVRVIIKEVRPLNNKVEG